MKNALVLRRLVMLLALMMTGGAAWSTELRVKSFISKSWLDESDVQSRLHDDAPLTGDGELRLMTGIDRDTWSLTWHHTAAWQGGDDVAFARSFHERVGGDGLRSPVDDDQRQLFDLSGRLDSGDRHQLQHRVERLHATWRGRSWSITAGREAVSLGGGILFHPMDFLNPFAPTTVDKDYKPGVDLIHVQRQIGQGDWGLLVVGRRDDHGDITRSVASFAARGRVPIGAVELEGLVAEHQNDITTAVGLRIPMGGTLLRTDVVATQTDEQGMDVSAVLNVDSSWVVANKLVYGFVEYYHNGFGVRELSPSGVLPRALALRRRRGEIFTLMRDYLGVGGTLQWHPLVTQSLTAVRNLHDGSMFLQGGLRFDLSDQHDLEVGALVLIGQGGEEFGGKPLALDTDGRLITSGTGTRAYLRWTWFPRFGGFNRD